MSARVGETVEGAGADGAPISVRVVWILDPADASFGAEGIGVPAGQRTVIVATELVNRGDRDYSAPPDLGLVLVDAAGSRYHRASAALTSYPRFRHVPVGPGEGVGGHTYFVLPRAAVLVVVQWSATGDVEEEAMTWAAD